MIYDNVAKYAEAKGVSVRKLERLSGLGNGAIGKWKDGKHKPTLYTLTAVAKVLGVSVDDLIREGGE